MTGSEFAAELARERAAHRETRETVLAMMLAIDAHLAGLRDGIAAVQAENDALRKRLADAAD